MILFFRTPSKSVIATEIDHKPSQDEINELCWLYGDATLEDAQQLQGFYVGPRREMITPLTSSSCHPKIFVKEFCYFLMSCHQHCLGINLLVQR